MRTPAVAACLLAVAAQCSAQNATAASTAASPGAGSSAGSGSQVPVFTTCGSIVVDDFGTAYLTPKVLNISYYNGYVPANFTYDVSKSVGLSIPLTFSQADVINGTVFAQPNVPIQTMGTSKTSSIVLSVYDPVGNSATCNISVTINYNFAPLADSNAAFAIATTTYSPVVIDRTILNVGEQHGLSMWNMNWTSIDPTFNKGNQGKLEYYDSVAGWLQLPLTQAFPVSWVDNGAIRYNPTRYVGSANLNLQLTNVHSVSVTPALPLASGPFNVTIVITVAASATTSTTTKSTANPPLANLNCPVSFPANNYPISYTEQFGTFCQNFTTVANVSTTWKSANLGVQLVVVTKAAAVVTFGTSIDLSSDYLPAGLQPISFVGYLDYGAFSLSSVPAGVITSAILTTPEMSYWQALAITNTSQVTGVQVNTNTKSQTQFFVTSVDTVAPPKLHMTLYSEGVYALLRGAATGGAGGATVQFGPNNFIASWGTKQFTFPSGEDGTLTANLTCGTDMSFSLLNSGNASWAPGGMSRIDYYTISTNNKDSPYTMLLSYQWTNGRLMAMNVDPSTIQWA
ncbi:hypothetical protein HK101_011140 [Irineochytrium annulatum]|nr:hypothetical protein HK101_011140 [Irineochytrium annulatum]